MDNIADGLKKRLLDPNLRKRYEEQREAVVNYPEVASFLKDHNDLVTPAVLERSFAKLNEFMIETKKRKEKQPVANPHLEPVLVWHGTYIDCVYRQTADYKREARQKAIKKRINSFYMSKDIAEASLSAIDLTPAREPIVSKMIGFSERYTSDPTSFQKGLYLYGNFGVGKSYMLAALAQQLAELGHQVTMVHYPSMAVELKNSFQNNTMLLKLNTLKESSILMLDDIGAEANSSWLRDDFLGVVLQYRMQEQLPTFFSSNFGFKELQKHFEVTQKGDVEPLKAMRIMERVRYLAEEVNVTGKNQRR